MSIPLLSTALRNAAVSLLGDGDREAFVFVGNSLLHMSSLNAWLLEQQSKGSVLKGIVCNDIPQNKKPQFGPSDILGYQKGMIQYLRDNVDYKVVRNKADRLASLIISPVDIKRCPSSFVFDRLVFIYPDHGMPCESYWSAVLDLAKKVECVAVEEGIAAYLPIESESSLFAYLNTSPLKRAFEVAKIKCLSKRKEAIRNRIRKQIHISRFGLFKTNDLSCHLEINTNYAYWMSRYFRYVRDEGVPVPSFDFSNTVVVLGTANADFVDQALVDFVLNGVIDAIIAAGYKVYYRPHPRQADSFKTDASRGFTVDQCSGNPIEEIIANASTKPIATVGFCSTAQLIARAFWDIPAIGISKILLEHVISSTKCGASRQFCNRLIYSESSFSEYYRLAGRVEEVLRLLKACEVDSVSANDDYAEYAELG